MTIILSQNNDVFSNVKYFLMIISNLFICNQWVKSIQIIITFSFKQCSHYDISLAPKFDFYIICIFTYNKQTY